MTRTWPWTPMELVVHVAACWRWCQLAIRDRITLPVRARVIRRAYWRAHDDGGQSRIVDESGQLTAREWQDMALADEDAPWLATLVTCWWCAGLWIATLWTATAWVWPAGWWWASVVAAGSGGLVLVADGAAVLGKAGQ